MYDILYKPIDKAFYTILQDLVARQKYCRVQYFTSLHEFITVRTVVKELVSEAGEEYLVLLNGEKIRLDRIYSVADNFAPGFENYHEFSCDR
jgi:Rho-binding antiterminator